MVAGFGVTLGFFSTIGHHGIHVIFFGVAELLGRGDDVDSEPALPFRTFITNSLSPVALTSMHVSPSQLSPFAIGPGVRSKS